MYIIKWYNLSRYPVVVSFTKAFIYIRGLTMVTTNSPNETLNFIPIKLKDSELDGDKELYQEVVETVETLVQRLKPILKYITPPIAHSFRGVVIVEKFNDGLDAGKLALSREGSWHLIRNAREVPRRKGVAEENPHVWKRVTFANLMEGLEKALERAAEKKRKHLEVVEERRDIVAQMREVARS